MKSLQLCQLQASENGPDTTERAPLDARGWVPSVFRARPAIKMQECLLALFRARTGRRRRRGPTRREETCAQRVYATNSLPRKSKKPSRGAAGLRPGRRDSVDAGGGSRAAETRRRRKLAPTSPGALRPLTTHAAPPGLRQAAQVHKSSRGTRQSGSECSARAGLARRLSFEGHLSLVC